MPPERFLPCRECKKPTPAGALHDHRCPLCRLEPAVPHDYWERAHQDAAVLSKVDAALPLLRAYLNLMERWEGYLRSWLRTHPDEPDPQPRRHRVLPAWQREQPTPLTYAGDE